jgi:hypothetical protein
MATPERELWASVIIQAMAEACAEDPKTQPKPDAKKRTTVGELRTRARRWLLSDSDDFRKVCEYAGVDPDAVRQRIAKRLKKARAA